MNLSVPERQKLKEVEDFAISRVRDRATEIDESSRYPEDLIGEMAKMGIFAAYIPREYGGLGFSLSTLMESIRIVSRECASTSLIPDVTVSLFGEPVLKYGTEFLKQKYLSRVSKGTIGALAITEPGTGSDAVAITTSAEKKGDRFILNGGKTFITNGDKDRLVVFSDKVVPDLKLYLMEMKDGKARGDFLFPTSRSKRISPVTVERVVRNIVKRSGLQKKVTPHTFRHTFATSLLRNGADLRIIQLLLGHSSISTTQIYTHMDDRALKMGYEKFIPSY